MRISTLFLCISGIVCTGSAAVLDSASIFPKPHEVRPLEGRFVPGEQPVIAVPARPSKSDLLLARLLTEELSDRWGVAAVTTPMATLPGDRSVIVMGTMANPLVREYCARHKVEPVSGQPEGYVLRVADKVALVAGTTEDGAFYGLQSLRQLIRGASVAIPGIEVRDWPDKPFRGIRIYLPGRNNIPFFKRFVRDFMALYKFNKLQIEVNAGMRLDRHPELNAGWVEFARDVNYSRRNYPAGPPFELRQNASHQETADGSFLEKAEVADMVEWSRLHHIEVIPEIPSLTHSYYLLTAHPELSEVPGERWPDTYCPSNPRSRELYFEVLDEYLEVMQPRMVHIGHDELFAPIHLCGRCKGKDMRELFARDLTAVHDHLAKRGIAAAMWGDMLLEDVRGKGPQAEKTASGFRYQTSGALTAELVRSLPKDMLIFNWFWNSTPDRVNVAKAREQQLEDFGFRQIYGNFRPAVPEYAGRSRRASLLGGAPSSWNQTSEAMFGKDLILTFLGCEELLWSGHVSTPRELAADVQARMPEIRRRLRGEAPPSVTGDAVVQVDLSRHFNMPAREAAFQVGLKTAVIVGTQGDSPNPLPREVNGIEVGEDATSLIFLHASARPATNKIAYRLIWDMDDTADLLGWYEVLYEDGFVLTVPIRYGVHLLEWNWRPGEGPETYCYAGDPVSVAAPGSDPITFFAYEWINPRPGKVIREVRLKGTTGFRGGFPGFVDYYGAVIPNNAVMLHGLSVVRKRSDADSQRLRTPARN